VNAVKKINVRRTRINSMKQGFQYSIHLIIILQLQHQCVL